MSPLPTPSHPTGQAQAYTVSHLSRPFHLLTRCRHFPLNLGRLERKRLVDPFDDVKHLPSDICACADQSFLLTCIPIV